MPLISINLKIMELREYYKILKSNISVVIYVVIIAVVATYAWSVRQSQIYSASLLLNISRTETQNSADYRYDQFYRLEADEKFAKTVVEWLKAPGIAREIITKSDVTTGEKSLRQLSKSFRAQNLSSQIIDVRFSAKSEDEAKKIKNSIESIVSEKTAGLNASASDPDWFEIKASDFIFVKNIQNIPLNLTIAALAGIFAGIFLAFGKHYISEENLTLP